jgi:hypothetical protein
LGAPAVNAINVYVSLQLVVVLHAKSVRVDEKFEDVVAGTVV